MDVRCHGGALNRRWVSPSNVAKRSKSTSSSNKRQIRTVLTAVEAISARSHSSGQPRSGCQGYLRTTMIGGSPTFNGYAASSEIRVGKSNTPRSQIEWCPELPLWRSCSCYACAKQPSGRCPQISRRPNQRFDPSTHRFVTVGDSPVVSAHRLATSGPPHPVSTVFPTEKPGRVPREPRGGSPPTASDW